MATIAPQRLREESTALRDALAEDLRPFSSAIPKGLSEIGLPIYVLDRRGILRWQNAAALELFGDRRGEHFTAFVAPESRLIAREAFARKMLGGVRTTSFDLGFIAADGRHFDAEVECVRLECGLEATGVFGIVKAELSPAIGALNVHLTPRQIQVLKLLVRGASTGQIANELHIATETVRNHIRSILHALHVHSRVQAVARAHQLDIL
jgi:DNA-binding CsgD family transcriptional regulator